MDWLLSGVREAIWGFLSDLADSAVRDGLQRLTDFLMDRFTDLNKYFDVHILLMGFQVIAVALLGYNVAKMVINRISGGTFGGDGADLTITQMIVKVTYAAGMIYFLPWCLIHVMFPLKNLVIKGIVNIAIAKFNLGSANDIIMDIEDLIAAGGMVILSYLVLGIALFILSIATVKMYFELIIAYLISPISAVSGVNSGEGIKIWFVETGSILATQATYVLLIQFMLGSLIIFKTDMVLRNLALIGLTGIMLSGPAIIKKYTYTSGVGSATARGVGSAVNMIAMRKMIRGTVVK